MIHSAEVKASAVQEASKFMFEPLAGSIKIGDMRIDDIPKYIDFEGLKIYDKKIKEYIDKRIDEKLSKLRDSKYKIIMGESD